MKKGGLLLILVLGFILLFFISFINAVEENTCGELGGDICLENERCSGIGLDSADSDRCCSVECEVFVNNLNKCSDCGVGLFNICDQTECESFTNIFGEGCNFSSNGLFWGNCKNSHYVSCTAGNCEEGNIIHISGCSTLDESGKTYVLDNDIWTMPGDCFKIHGANIVLDGRGHSLFINMTPFDYPADPENPLDFSPGATFLIKESNYITIKNFSELFEFNKDLVVINSSQVNVPLNLISSYNFINSILIFEKDSQKIEFTEAINSNSLLNSNLRNVVLISLEDMDVNTDLEPNFNARANLHFNFDVPQDARITYNGVPLDNQENLFEVLSYNPFTVKVRGFDICDGGISSVTCNSSYSYYNYYTHECSLAPGYSDDRTCSLPSCERVYRYNGQIISFNQMLFSCPWTFYNLDGCFNPQFIEGDISCSSDKRCIDNLCIPKSVRYRVSSANPSEPRVGLYYPVEDTSSYKQDSGNYWIYCYGGSWCAISACNGICTPVNQINKFGSSVIEGIYSDPPRARYTFDYYGPLNVTKEFY